MQETPVQFLGWEIPWRRRDMLPTPVFLGFPGGSVGKESAFSAEALVSIPGLGKSPAGGCGNSLQYSFFGESPWTEQPGGLTSMGSQRVGHN